jgi:diguanylate cyclase (GGDEF)-like protein
MGKNCRFLQGTDQKQPGLEDVRQALNQGRECRVTLRNYRKDGSLFWNEVSLSPIRDEMGKITYFIAIQTDITERKRSEEERQRYEASLQKMNRELYKVNDALYRLANSDGLTGVANRRCFDEHLEKEFRRMAREKLPLSLILGDIDCFKRYNDNYGHLQGDDCLKTVAQILAQSTHRPDDLVARFGGEEFAILLPNTPAEGAMHVAQAILQQVRQLQIPHEFSSVNAYITLSLGVATLMPTPELSSNGLIQAADRALYQAKEQGRDRVVTYSL